jgi:hypothetical protein
MNSYKGMFKSYSNMVSNLFYDLSRTLVQPGFKNDHNKLFSFEIITEITQVRHNRIDYTFIDLLGDIGGI